MTERRTVFIAVTHGTHAALLLRSSFLETLKEVETEQLRIVILSPNAEEEYFLREFEDYADVELLQSQSTWLFSRLNWARRYTLLDSRASRSHEIILTATRERSPVQYWVVNGLNYLTGKWAWISKLIRWIDRRVFPDRKYGKLFERYCPDLLVIASVVHDLAFYLLRRAKLNGVPTLFVVESWDNPTCKVGFFERPEQFTVWNKIMKDEMVEFHTVEQEQIHITGAAYHDVYADMEALCSRDQLAARYGMDPEVKWIGIAATLSDLYPDFDEFMERLDNARADAAFGQDVQFLIRPHPQAIAGYSLGHGVEELDRMCSQYPSVFFDIPTVLSQKLPVDLDILDAKRLAEILLHMDVVISFFSTVTIHACVVDTPVVLPAFRDYREKIWFPTMAQRLEFNHHSNVIETGGVSLVSNYDGVVEAVRRYLQEPSLHRDGRQRIVMEQCGVIDGQAGRRTAEVVLGMLDLPVPKSPGN